MHRLCLLLALLVATGVSACGRVAAPSSPETMLTPTELPSAPVEVSPTLAPVAIPGGVETVTLASEGEFIVTGTVEITTGLAHFLDSAGWLYVLDGASLEVVAKERVLPALEEGQLYELAVDSAAGRVYLADWGREHILVLDAETLSPLGQIDAFGRMAVDTATHHLYVARVGVYVADGETRSIVGAIEETIPEEGMELYSGVPRGVDVYINSDSRHLYVMTSNNTPGSNSRWWLDLYDADDYTLLAEQLPLPYCMSDAPGFNPERDLDYVAGGHPIVGDSKLVALDAQATEVAHLWGVRGDVFSSPRRDLLYVSHWDELDIVDAETMNYLGSYPLRVTLHDPLNGRFYFTDWSDATVSVFDEPIASQGPRAATSEWTGGLPTPDLADIDSLVLSPAFSSDETVFVAARTSLFISTDRGDSWREMILPFTARGTAIVGFSPRYARDGTVLLGFDCTPSGSGILRSTDAALHWARMNSGLTDLGIRALVFSPNYTQDETIFARACFDGVFKSTDGGLTWRRLTSGVTSEQERDAISELLVSPAFARDRTLWILASSGVYRSEDGGDSWQRADRGLEGLELQKLVISPSYEMDKTAFVTAGNATYVTQNKGEDWRAVAGPLSGLWVTDLVLSPDFATDGVLFVVGWDEHYRDRLFRSPDGGETWLEVGLSTDSLRALAISPSYSADEVVFAAGDRGVYRSSDGGETWQTLTLPGAWAPSFVFSPDFESDRTLYAVLGQLLYRSGDGGVSWTALHRPLTAPTPGTASPIPRPTATPAPPPSVSPTPLGCPGLDPIFQPVAGRLESLRRDFRDAPDVGCPAEAPRSVNGAWQMFLVQSPGYTGPNPPGYMIWRSDSRTVYVVLQAEPISGISGVLTYDDTWSEGMPEIPPACAGYLPTAGLQIPIRGFGKVWCENSLYDRIGFAYDSEQGGDLLLQETEQGLYLALPDGRSFAIDITNGLALSH